MASSLIFSCEKRPLKRPKLGPPDVYPQDPKQREDELTAVNVKQGFSHVPQLSDEFGTAKNTNINAAKLGAFINGALAKRHEANTLPDTGKRRLQVNTKDHFWHVTHTPRHKQVLEGWMKDLAGGKPLAVIAKKVPIFNKREEIFLTLAEHNVPMLRAGWFLKMTASYNSAISEAKTKKRQMPDPSQEWTISLTRCCKDLLLRISDWYGGGTGSISSNNSLSSSGGGTGSGTSPLNSSSGNMNGPNSGSTPIMGMSEDGNISLKQWLYCMDLAKYLYEEGLLDRYEWLVWVIDTCDKIKAIDDPPWKALLPVILTFLPEIAQSELLARRLATLSARKLSNIFTDQDFIPSGSDDVLPPPPPALMERLKCPTHRPTVLGLCSAIQVILLECPTAMVFNSHPMAPQSESGRNSVPGGSPLDILPIPPSVFPMPPRANNTKVREQLMEAEDQVIARSRAIEAKWSCDEWQQSSAGSTLQKVLAALDALDRYNFEKFDTSNSLESLYAQIFPNPPVRDNPVDADAPIVILLCKWAVGYHRNGEHRALAVARLLEQRQSHILSSNNDNSESNQQPPTTPSSDPNVKVENGDNEVTMTDVDNGDGSSGSNKPSHMNGHKSNNEEGEFPLGIPIFHSLLLQFLDKDAPKLDDSVPHSKSMFASLVTLFSTLIRHDVFSHDAYLSTLIARGDLTTTPQTNNSGGTSATIGPPSSVQPIPSVGPASQGPGGPGTPASVSSAPNATPKHDGDERGSLFPPLPRIQEIPRHTDFDDPNIDDDLDRILQHITQDQMDQADSPKDDTTGTNNSAFGSGGAPFSNSSSDTGGNRGLMGDSKYSRHRQYVMHFQLPQDESYVHEINQRQIVLYGVGRAREEAKHAVKKVSKELNKMFSKKFCHDVSDASRVKKYSKNEINFDSLTNKYSMLPYYDQHAITTSITQNAVEMLTSFVSGRSNYLPTFEHIGYLMDLMELGLNYVGLLDFCMTVLHELPEIESSLSQRNSPITSLYISNMELQVVAIFRRYLCSLLLDSDMTVAAWDNLIQVLKRVVSVYECSSADRCALAFLTELQSCCGHLRTKPISDYLTQPASKLRQSLFSDVRPADPSSHNWNQNFMTQCLEFPRRKVEIPILRQLLDNPSCRYSFVCNAVLAICNEADADRVNDLACLCAEMTAACPSLAAEWLGVLQTLCSPSGSRHSPLYADILSAVDVKHLSIHSSLATLTALLVSRQCFSLEDFVKQAVFSLLKAWNEGRGPYDPDTEAGARLTCQLLLNLFKTQGSGHNILKLSCDRRLLSATHNSVTLGAVCAALKAMLLLADAAGTGERRRDQRIVPGMGHGELSISHILGTSDVPNSGNNDCIRGEPRTLASYAYAALQQMCREPWVRQRCLQNPLELCTPDTFLDQMVSAKQAQRLLHLICYPEVHVPEDGLDPLINVPRLMESLELWNMREALLTLTLQYKQLTGYNTSNSVEYANWLDIVARGALDVFHLNMDDGQEASLLNSAAPSPAPGKSPRSGKKQGQSLDPPRAPPTALGIGNPVPGAFGGSTTALANGIPNALGITPLDKGITHGPMITPKTNANDTSSCGWTPPASWLLAPLITKLGSAVQGRVLRHAGNVLEAYFKRKTATWSNNSGGSLQAHLPFLALILACLRGQDEQREGLLASLLAQFAQILSLAELPEVDPQSEAFRDVLRLRLSLVGGMFDAIQRSGTATSEWAVVLTQLVTHQVVDLNTNSDIFPTVIDMITALVHSTQIAEPGDRIEEMKRQNMNLIKKLKKELADRDSPSIKPLRQLLPFSKVQIDIVVTTATSMIVDSKGNRVQSSEFVDKKPGLQVWEKQRVSPWEVVEGQKNSAQLSWGWFGAVKMDRKPLRYEEAHRLLRYHTHHLMKPTSHFLEPVPLPPEDIDSKPPDYLLKEELLMRPGPDQSPVSDQSPTIITTPGGRQIKAKAPRKRRQTKGSVGNPPPPINSPNQIPPPMPPVPVMNNFNSPQVQNHMAPVPMSNQGPPPNYPQGNWYNGNPNQPPMSQQQQYFTQGPTNPGPGRPPLNQPKQMLNQMLRARHHAGGIPVPTQVPSQFNQFQPNTGVTPGGPGPRHQNILRQQLRGQSPMQNQNFQQQPQQGGPPPNQGIMFQQQNIPQQGQGVGQQNYGFTGQGTPSSVAQANPQLNQMLGPRGGAPQGGGGPPPNQDLSNFMQGPGPQRHPSQRPNFMQGNPQGGQGMSYRAQGQMVGAPNQMGMGQPQGPGPGHMGGQMGQPDPGMGGGPGAQRMRQFVMQQQQQQPPQGMGMGGPGPRMQYQSQGKPGGGYL